MRKEFTYQGGADERLDRVLLTVLQGAGDTLATRSQVERLIERGAVQVNGKVVAKAGVRIKPGAQVVYEELRAEPVQLVSYHEELPILYQDDALLVIDKPSGIPMHPGAGTTNRTIVQMVLGHLERTGWSDPERPGIVHRLDKDTTGVVVVARTVGVHAALAAQFAAHSVERAYVGLVLSRPRKRALDGVERGVLESKIRRAQSDRRKMEIVALSDPTPGRRAVTEWKVNEWMEYAALCTFRLQTGRTHQIRAHLTSRGAPLIGDKTYRIEYELPRRLLLAAKSFGRQALHAGVLGFTHPVTGERMSFTSHIPPDFAELVRVFRIPEGDQ